MPTKIFTTLGGNCPFGRGCELDSPRCRQCQHYYRAGTGTFFWCNTPKEDESVSKSIEIVPKTTGIVHDKPKRGRPRKKAISKPVKKRITKK